MEAATMQALTQAGAFSAIGLAAVGSALGTGAAGASAVGAWKKCYANGKPAPFQLAVFAGAPLSQTIYGMILMFLISGKAAPAQKVIDAAVTTAGAVDEAAIQAITVATKAAYAPTAWAAFLIMGVVAGLGMGCSAWMQGKAAAGACDAFAETGDGFTNYLMALGIIETVAIFVMAFAIVLLGSVGA